MPLDLASPELPPLVWTTLVAGAGVLALIALTVYQWAHNVGRRSLRRLGYLPGPGPGEWTARLDPIRLTWRPMSGFVVRLGVYSRAQVRMTPRASAHPLSVEPFELGIPEVDDRWRFSSEAPAYARELILHPSVLEALRVFPPAPVALRGDELHVSVRRRYAGVSVHDAVLRLAHALIRATAR